MVDEKASFLPENLGKQILTSKNSYVDINTYNGQTVCHIPKMRKMIQKIEHEDKSNEFSDRKTNKHHSSPLHSQDHQRLRRSQSPFQRSRSPNSRSLLSDPTLHSTTSISSTFENNVLLQGYHQPLTALRKLVEINRNIIDNPAKKNDNQSPNAEFRPSSPVSSTNNDENESTFEDDFETSACKGSRLSSMVDASLASTPDSMSSHSTSQSNNLLHDSHSNVCFYISECSYNFSHKFFTYFNHINLLLGARSQVRFKSPE